MKSETLEDVADGADNNYNIENSKQQSFQRRPKFDLEDLEHIEDNPRVQMLDAENAFILTIDLNISTKSPPNDGACDN